VSAVLRSAGRRGVRAGARTGLLVWAKRVCRPCPADRASQGTRQRL